jgi:hypothetical protein
VPFSALGRILVPGSMSPRPLNSNRGHSCAARHRGPRGRVCRLFPRGPRAPERSLWTREPRPWHLRLSGGLGRKKSHVRGRKVRSGDDLVISKSPFCEVPRPPEPTPLDSPPPAGPFASWGRQHTFWVLGRQSVSHARLGPFSGPMRGHA